MVGTGRRPTSGRRYKLSGQLNYFYAGLADESHEPQFKALGRYLKEQKIMTVRIFKEIGGLGDLNKDGMIYPE